jgi:hypothetical protein
MKDGGLGFCLVGAERCWNSCSSSVRGGGQQQREEEEEELKAGTEFSSLSLSGEEGVDEREGERGAFLKGVLGEGAEAGGEGDNRESEL